VQIVPGFSGLRQYNIVGRGYPSEREPNPKIFKMTVFSKNPVVAIKVLEIDEDAK